MENDVLTASRNTATTRLVPILRTTRVALDLSILHSLQCNATMFFINILDGIAADAVGHGSRWRTHTNTRLHRRSRVVYVLVDGVVGNLLLGSLLDRSGSGKTFPKSLQAI